MAGNPDKETCVIRTVQERLNAYGYDAGAEDNEEGPDTYAAIARMKAQYNLDPRPYLGIQTLSIIFSENFQKYKRPPTPPIDPNSEAPWLDYFLKFEGIKEIPGAEHNPVIVQWGKDSGIDWWNNDEDAWCAVAINGSLVNTGYKSTRSAMARSFSGYSGDFENIGYGDQLDPRKPLPRGTIVVFARASYPSGHVEMVIKDRGDGTIETIGGNVSNMVKRSVRRKSEIVDKGARWPSAQMKVAA